MASQAVTGTVGRFLWSLPAILGLGLLTWLSFLIPGLQMRRAHPVWFWLAWIFLAGAIIGFATGGGPLAIVWIAGIVLYFIMLRSWNRFAKQELLVTEVTDVIDAPPPPLDLPVTENAAITVEEALPAQAPVPTPAPVKATAPPPKAVEINPEDKAPIVFISHATEDRESTQVLASELESRGVRTWLAYRDVGVGSNYAEEIVKAIVGADYLLVVLSESAIESPHIRREVTIGIDRGIPLLPVNMSESEDFMWTLPVDWTYWLSLAQVMRHTDEASTASELARRITR